MSISICTPSFDSGALYRAESIFVDRKKDYSSLRAICIMSNTDIKLRLGYWNCRGRVQAVRYMLEDIAYAHKNVDYKEEFEVLEKGFDAWLPRKADENISGPFHNLPVLHWNDENIFGQTLTIGWFSKRKIVGLISSVRLSRSIPGEKVPSLRLIDIEHQGCGRSSWLHRWRRLVCIHRHHFERYDMYLVHG
jgi:hypothetical protein